MSSRFAFAAFGLAIGAGLPAQATQVQPPPRPIEFARTEPGIAPSPATADAMPAIDASTPIEPVAAAPAGAIVTVLPPLRPTLPGDGAGNPASVETAPAAADIAADPGDGSDLSVSVVQVLPPQRPSFAGDQAIQAAVIAEPVAAPPPQPSLFSALFGPRPSVAPAPATEPSISTGRPALDAMIAYHAKLNGVPESLVHRIVVRESRYNPRLVGRGGAMGLMQIKTPTARALGYEGTPAGLLDAETNITYAVKYLAGAWRTARGNADLAVRHYASGYYYAAKRQGLIQVASRSRRNAYRQEADAAPISDEAPTVTTVAATDRATR